MIQDFNTSVKKLVDGNGVPAGDTFVPRLCETLFSFAMETVRDLRLPEWRSQFHGGLNAGYILGLLGESTKCVEFLDKSLRIHQENRGEYCESEATVLKFIVTSLQDFGIEQPIVDQYKRELEVAREKEKEKPQDLARRIAHIEADLECAEGDLDQAYSHGRREQGLLYQRLGDHEKALEKFRHSIAEDRQDRRSETTIKNSLAIVDSYLAMDNREEALKVFAELMRTLGPLDLKLGSQLPELFTSHFSVLHPYFEKLGIEESMVTVAQYAAARLKTIVPKKHRDRSEICELSKILAVYYVSRGDYQKASDIFDAGREQLEYKHHLSRSEQAEFALRAGNPDKARELITQDDAEKDSMGMDRDEKVLELASLELQMGNISGALYRLDGYCDRHKRCLGSGSYSTVFEARRAQVDIMKGAIGKDYVQKVRDHLKGRSDLRLLTGIKFLEASKVKKADTPANEVEDVDD
jgi:tetratricopeptide (TPR) repeat protein